MVLYSGRGARHFGQHTQNAFNVTPQHDQSDTRRVFITFQPAFVPAGLMIRNTAKS